MRHQSDPGLSGLIGTGIASEVLPNVSPRRASALGVSAWDEVEVTPPAPQRVRATSSLNCPGIISRNVSAKLR